MQVLCGDIGGTNTRMAIADVDFDTGQCKVNLVDQARYPSTSHTSLGDIVRLFLETRPSPAKAAFGVAGPVRDGVCRVTNLPWEVDENRLVGIAGIAEVRLLNDLEATAWGIGTLPESDLKVLNAGAESPQGNQSVIAAGTGLGQAGIYFDRGNPHPFASEGGHTDFAPTDDQEYALHAYLKAHYGHVSWERLVSGLGLVDIFQFMCQHKGTEIPEWFSDEMRNGDAGAMISRRADDGSCPLCEQTMRLFIRLYGRETGNHALKIMATGGVYLGGGIAPKILHRLMEGDFLEAFFDKGRMSSLMRDMPVKVILNDATALRGAARVAASLLPEQRRHGRP